MPLFLLLCTGIRGKLLLTFSGIFFFWIEGWVGGVYRIQAFFGLLYFFYIYKAPYSENVNKGWISTPATMVCSPSTDKGTCLYIDIAKQ